jgi:hypothetical protein
MLLKVAKRFADWSVALLAAIFQAKELNPGSFNTWFERAWLAGLYLAGGALWGKFLNWGRIPFDFHDWAEISAPRLAFIRDAVIKGALPLHMPDASALRNVTDRFMSIPDALLSPQILLMRWMDVGQFILVDTLLLYTLGFLALLWLRRKFSISPISFAIIFFLFNFNGHITSHMSIGHASWGGYFLFPWFVIFTLQLLEGEKHTWRWAARMSILLFLVFLQGSFHQYVWMLIFLGLLGITCWRTFLPVLKAGLFAGLLSMVRLLPPVLEMSKFDNEFLGGYPSLHDLWQSLVSIRFPEQALSSRSMFTTLGWWEFDLYIGLGGTLILVIGTLLWLRRWREKNAYAELFIPLAVLSFFTFGRMYQVLRLIPIPLLSGERVTSRMISLPFVFVLILGIVAFDQWMQARPSHSGLKVIGLAGLGIIIHDLWQHLKAWQVTNAFPAFPLTPTDLSIKIVANHPDPIYMTYLGVGAAVSLLSLVVLLVLARRTD